MMEQRGVGEERGTGQGRGVDPGQRGGIPGVRGVRMCDGVQRRARTGVPDERRATIIISLGLSYRARLRIWSKSPASSQPGT